MSKTKIRENRPNKQTKHIKETQNAFVGGSIHFSFKHLDLTNDKFSVKRRDSKYFEKMLDRLRNVSTIKLREFKNNHSKSLRAHRINWNYTTEKNGFSHLNEQLQGDDAYQFEVSGNEHGRVHGFFIENIFFVVWFDPDHKLYPGV
jgi:hypothetical protein